LLFFRPSSRVATAERKLKLVNDASAKDFSTRSVECLHCRETVALEGEGDYDLTNWEAHKLSCAGYVSRLNALEGLLSNTHLIYSFIFVSSIFLFFLSLPLCHASVSPDKTVAVDTKSPSPQSEKAADPPRSPAAASPDTTANDASSSAPGPSRGLKRGREDEGTMMETAEEGARPAVRQRTASYVSLDWLLAPFRSFVAGFKEGMSLSSEDQSPGVGEQ
jgi:hypothetical protein